MVVERVIEQPDGRALRAYDSGGDWDAFTVVWHHGSPQSGAPVEPLLAAAASRGIRVVSYGRPSYGGSTPRPGRDVATAADDVARIVDTFGVGRFATMGSSGGGPPALACGALLPERVTAVATLGGLAPFTGEADWFAGMADPSGLQAAVEGRAARAAYAEVEEFDRDSFTAADWAALAGTWAALGADAARAGQAWPDGLVDDDVAGVQPWGFDLAQVAAPVLVVHGGEDRVVPPSHADRLLRHLPNPELWLRPHDGHISVLDACPLALDWLVAHSAPPS